MSFFFSIVHNYKVSDIATCYKLFPQNFFTSVNFVEKGFSIEIEIISKFLKYNKSIVESPIRYEGRSYREGKKSNFWTAFIIYLILLNINLFLSYNLKSSHNSSIYSRNRF